MTRASRSHHHLVPRGDRLSPGIVAAALLHGGCRTGRLTTVGLGRSDAMVSRVSTRLAALSHWPRRVPAAHEMLVWIGWAERLLGKDQARQPLHVETASELLWEVTP